jgi:hypothetical protein
MKLSLTSFRNIGLFVILSFFAAFSLHAQITISADNMPVPDSLITDSIPNLLGPAPEIGEGLVYDYGNDTTYTDIESALFSSVFRVLPDLPELAELIAAGGDKSRLTGTDFGNGLFYLTFEIMDFNENGVFQVGQAYNNQAFSLAAFTGNPSDSIYFPFNAYTAENPMTRQAFPYTLGSNWTDTMRLETDFIIDIPAFGLPNVPGQHVFYEVRTDSILGYGTVRVYTPEGPSEAMDVLVNKHFEYKIDSFYLNGAPAPAPLLTSFGLENGQISSPKNFIDFVAEDIYPYLVRFSNLEPIGNFEQFDEVFLQRGVVMSSSTFEIAGAQYSTVVYPNPSNGGQLNVQLTGVNFPDLSYEVSDLSGRVIRSGRTGPNTGGQLTVNFPTPLPAGNYYLSLRTDKGMVVATESIIVE